MSSGLTSVIKTAKKVVLSTMQTVMAVTAIK